MRFEGVVFPGQGTQYIGMGKDFYENYPVEIKNIFNQANDAINIDLYDICQHNENLLNLTEYSQPCILTVEIAMYEVLKKYYGIKKTTKTGEKEWAISPIGKRYEWDVLEAEISMEYVAL